MKTVRRMRSSLVRCASPSSSHPNLSAELSGKPATVRPTAFINLQQVKCSMLSSSLPQKRQGPCSWKRLCVHHPLSQVRSTAQRLDTGNDLSLEEIEVTLARRCLGKGGRGDRRLHRAKCLSQHRWSLTSEDCTRSNLYILLCKLPRCGTWGFSCLPARDASRSA